MLRGKLHVELRISRVILRGQVLATLGSVADVVRWNKLVLDWRILSLIQEVRAEIGGIRERGESWGLVHKAWSG